MAGGSKEGQYHWLYCLKGDAWKWNMCWPQTAWLHWQKVVGLKDWEVTKTKRVEAYNNNKC